MVKKWCVAALVALATGVPVAAEAQMAVGLRSGLRWAGLQGEEETDSGTGIVAGGYFGFGVADQLAIQFELNYGARSFSGLTVGDNALDSGAPPSEVSMRYLEVPILLRVGLPGERLMPSFFAGPYAGFLLSCDLQPEGGDRRNCDESDQPEWFNPQTTDLGLAFGAALDLAMGEGSLYLDVRYGLGLLSIHSGDAFSAHHAGMDFSAGFAFPIGR